MKWKHQLYFQTNEKPAARNIVFEDFLVEYYLPFAENNHCKDSFYKNVSICKEALKLFRGMNLRLIKPADVEKFKSIQEKTQTVHGVRRKPATIARELSVISKVFSVAVKNDFLEYNPCSRIEKPQFDNIQNRILRLEDEEKFFASFKSEWARDVCVLVLNTGLRQNDALGLSKSHVDWNLEVIRSVQGKTGRKVIIPMNKTVQKLLQARWQNGNDLLFPSPKTGRRGISVKKAMLGAGDNREKQATSASISTAA